MIMKITLIMNNVNHNKNKYIYMYGPAIMINLKEKKNECASSEIYMQLDDE